MGWSQLLGALELRQAQLDQQTARLCRLSDAGATQIYCAKGCSNCCSLAVHCSFPEALLLAKDLAEDQWEALYRKIPLLRQISEQAGSLKQFLRLFRQQMDGCPFLEPNDGCCSGYSLRPLSCRALLSTRNSSWCAVDFADLHPLEKDAFLSSLDPEIVAFPTHYLAESQDLGLDLETLTLAEMREVFGVSLSGNLLYQLWLEAEYHLSEVLPAGFAASRAFLEDRGLDLPFLLQMQGD